ncbi:hypothetical protein TCA2_5454 [Paenibacillus sp. TCA20]|uniref:DUF4184 family protein n=1 Tax=Paenibacillus TaxID=44249 RepID=UPI0004D520D2|nr:DUF4184 family protein [Paenibacillus sp. TCA20]GAK42960.1 hypothetical protein TCA2_5454 [Paenibacillus sp. TCA20]
MPFTFAHPAAVLPFSRKSKYLHFTALVLGSMAPDFEYLLRGQPAGMTGHTFAGFFYFNLPLVALVYLIYYFFIHQTLMDHLPVFMQDRSERTSNFGLPVKIIIFCYSALLGMLTHVVWDAFTHQHGFVVDRIPLLSVDLHVLGYEIPIYKILQHGGTLAGLSLILIYILYRARKYNSLANRSTPSAQKSLYWLCIALLSIVFFIIWFIADPVAIHSIGVHVIRVIDSGLLSLLLVSIFFKFKKNKVRLQR